MSENRLDYLFTKHFNKTATAAEREEFMSLLHQSVNDEEVKALMEGNWKIFNATNEQPFSDWQSREMLENILYEEVPVIGNRRRLLVRFSAAAAVILLIAGLLWLSESAFTKFKKGQNKVQLVEKDIAPGSNKAILMLADGTKKELDNKDNGLLLQQDAVQVITPRGGQYQVTLPDGTKAWLNAASSISFPTVFNKERKITITGEVYLEIAQDKSKPFLVTSRNTQVQVLGTSFNINSYEDEEEETTTLLEGSIKVIPLDKGVGREATGGLDAPAVILKPNEQATLNHSANTKILIQTINPSETIAWKSGLFEFNEASIETIMRQLARWYNLEVNYKGTITRRFVASVPRNLPISQVLKALELTKAVRFEIEGNKITVLPPA